MTTYYIDDGGSNTAPYDTLAKAANSIVTAFAAGSAGDEFRVKDDHSESGLTALTSPGTTTLPCKLISIDASLNYSKASAAQFASSGDFSLTGKTKCYGIYFTAIDDFKNENGNWDTDNCTFYGTGTGAIFNMGGALPYNQIHKNLTINSATTSAVLGGVTYLNAKFDNILMTASSASNIFVGSYARHMKLEVINSDLSSVQSIFSLSLAAHSHIEFKRCKFHATAIYSSGVTNNDGSEINYYSCDNGTGYHFFYYENYNGIVIESTTVERTSGATYDGTNGFTAEFRPNTNVVELTNPLRYMLAAPVINIKDAAVVVEINVLLQDSAGTPVSLTDKNCILRVVYPDSTTLSLGKTVSSTTKDVLDAAADLSSVTVTFTGTSGTTKQHTLTATVPQNNNTGMDAAVCEIWLELSKDLASTTEMFVCPKFDIG